MNMAAVVTKKNLVLGFTTGEGKNLNLTINTPKEGLDGTTIGTAMDQIIAANALGEESIVNNKVSAKYVIQQVDEIKL